MLASVKSFAIAFAVAILIFGITAYCTYPYINNDLLGGFTAVEQDTTSDEGEITPPEETLPEGELPSEITGRDITALFVISDYQPNVFHDYRADVKENASFEEYAENQRHYTADTIVIMHADSELGEYVFTALPNDTLINYATRQITVGELYEQVGIDTTRQAISATMGLSIDCHIVMRFDLLKNVIDLFGGVEFNVPEKMYAVYEDERIISPGQSTETIETVDENGNPIIIRPGRPYVIDLYKGHQILNGDCAVQMLRYEGYAKGQRERASVAAQFLREFAQQFFDPSRENDLKAAVNLIIGSDSGLTDLTAEQFEADLPMITAYRQLTKKTVEVPGEMKDVGAESFFVVDQKKSYELFKPYKS